MSPKPKPNPKPNPKPKPNPSPSPNPNANPNPNPGELSALLAHAAMIRREKTTALATLPEKVRHREEVAVEPAAQARLARYGEIWRDMARYGEI